MVQYLVEEKSFRHQRLTPSAVVPSGTHPDGSPVIVHTEAEPDPMQEFQDYMDDKATASWELVQFERLLSSSNSYKFLFIFTKA